MQQQGIYVLEDAGVREEISHQFRQSLGEKPDELVERIQSSQKLNQLREDEAIIQKYDSTESNQGIGIPLYSAPQYSLKQSINANQSESHPVVLPDIAPKRSINHETNDQILLVGRKVSRAGVPNKYTNKRVPGVHEPNSSIFKNYRRNSMDYQTDGRQDII